MTTTQPPPDTTVAGHGYFDIAAASAPPRAPRRVKLQINTSGAWRNVIDFDVDDGGEVCALAETLVARSLNPDRSSLRVITPNAVPLMLWTPETGWRAWGSR